MKPHSYKQKKMPKSSHKKQKPRKSTPEQMRRDAVILKEKVAKADSFYAATHYKEAIDLYAWNIKRIRGILNGKNSAVAVTHEELLKSLAICQARQAISIDVLKGFAVALPYFTDAIGAQEQCAIMEPTPAVFHDLGCIYLACAQGHKKFAETQLYPLQKKDHQQRSVVGFEKAMQAFKKIPASQLTVEQNIYIRNCCINLRDLFKLQENYQGAIKYAKLAIATYVNPETISRETLSGKDYLDLSFLYQGLVKYHQQIGSNEDSIVQHYHDIIDAFDQAKVMIKASLTQENYLAVGSTLVKLNDYYTMVQDVKKKQEYLQKQLVHYLEYEERWAHIDNGVLKDLAYLYMALEYNARSRKKKIDYIKKAIAYQEKFIGVAREKENKLFETYSNLGRYYGILAGLYAGEGELLLMEEAYQKALFSQNKVPLSKMSSDDISNKMVYEQSLANLNSNSLPLQNLPQIPVFHPRDYVLEFSVALLAIFIAAGLLFRKKRSKKPMLPKKTTQETGAEDNKEEKTSVQQEPDTDGILDRQLAQRANFDQPQTVESTSLVSGRIPRGKQTEEKAVDLTIKKANRDLLERINGLASRAFKYIRAKNLTNADVPPDLKRIVEKYEAGFPHILSLGQIKAENRELNKWEKTLQSLEDAITEVKVVVTPASPAEVKVTIFSDAKRDTQNNRSLTEEKKSVIRSVTEGVGSDLGGWIMREHELTRNDIFPKIFHEECSFGDMRIMRYALAGVLARNMEKISQNEKFPTNIQNEAKVIRNAIFHDFHRFYTRLTVDNFLLPAIKKENEMLLDQAAELLAYLGEVDQDLTKMGRNLTKKWSALKLAMYKEKFVQPSKESSTALADGYLSDFDILCGAAEDERNAPWSAAMGCISGVGGAQAALLPPGERGKYAKFYEMGREFRHAPAPEPYQKMAQMTAAAKSAHKVRFSKLPLGSTSSFLPRPPSKKSEGRVVQTASTPQNGA